jgi:hypothetical protein
MDKKLNPTLAKIMVKAKQLYKTGRYKKWTDAVKAASGKKVGAVKIIQKGETKKSPVKKVLQQTRTKKGEFKGYKTIGAIDKQIGAVKSGSRYVYFKGFQIEKKPVVTTKGKRKKTTYVYLVHYTLHHTLASAKKYITDKSKK